MFLQGSKLFTSFILSSQKAVHLLPSTVKYYRLSQSLIGQTMYAFLSEWLDVYFAQILGGHFWCVNLSIYEISKVKSRYKCKYLTL